MPYIDKDFKPTLFEYTNVNDYNRLLVYYPRKGGRGVLGCDFTYELLVTPTPTPTSSITPTPSITPTLTPTPTPSSSAPAFDADAAAYLADVIASGGTTDATISAATDTLFTSLKSNGLYSKIYAMYPYVGGTASSHAIEAKLNKSFDITWFGGMTHDVSGSTGNGSNGYGDTGYNAYVEIGSTGGIASHSSVYVGTTSLGNYAEFGYRQGSPAPTWIMAVKFGGSSGTYYGWHYTAGGGNELLYTNADAKGNYIQSRETNTNLIAYKNGVLQATKTNTESNSAPNGNLRVFNDTSLYSDRRLQFTTIGDGLSAGEIVILDGIINTFQTSLGRNTY